MRFVRGPRAGRSGRKHPFTPRHTGQSAEGNSETDRIAGGRHWWKIARDGGYPDDPDLKAGPDCNAGADGDGEAGRGAGACMGRGGQRSHEATRDAQDHQASECEHHSSAASGLALPGVEFVPARGRSEVRVGIGPSYHWVSIRVIPRPRSHPGSATLFSTQVLSQHRVWD
jgi:hypothetical protein